MATIVGLVIAASNDIMLSLSILEFNIMKAKTCVIHGELTEETAYLCKDKNCKGGIRYRCKQCCHDRRVLSYFNNKDEAKAYSKKWKEENPEYNRENAKKNYHKDIVTKRKKELSRKKGLALEVYENMVLECDNKCHICNKPETRKMRSGGVSGNLSIDHCHKTNVIRGLLCHACNTAIGKFKDDIQLLYKAIEYLRKYEDDTAIKQPSSTSVPAR